MSTFLDVMRLNQSLVVREVNNCKRSVHLQLRMLQYLLLASFPGLYTPHYKMWGRGGGLVRKVDKWCKLGSVAHNFR